MAAFDWDTFDRAEQNQSDIDVAQVYWREFFNLLFEYNIMEPKVPINTECQAPKLLEFEDVDCGQYPDAFLTSKRQTAARIGHMVQLGFDVDMLEIHLNELADVVDYFFIIEWTETHNDQFSPKRLTWEAIKAQPRFEKFQNKVVHFIMDDLDTLIASASNNPSQFGREYFQEKRRWTKFQEWNNVTKHFGPDDVLGFGDADEISSRTNVQLLKYCNIKNREKLDMGLWFPFGKIDQAFRTDFPVKGHPYTYGDPTFWVMDNAKKSVKYPTRQRGRSGAFLLGGIHMTHYGYFPFQIIKRLSCTECNNQGKEQQMMRKKIAAAVKEQKWLVMEEEWSQVPADLSHRVKKLAQIPDSETKVLS